MSDYSEAYEARVGADRMEAGLHCIPDPVHGDLEIVKKLRRELAVRDAEKAALLVANDDAHRELAEARKETSAAYGMAITKQRRVESLLALLVEARASMEPDNVVVMDDYWALLARIDTALASDQPTVRVE